MSENASKSLISSFKFLSTSALTAAVVFVAAPAKADDMLTDPRWASGSGSVTQNGNTANVHVDTASSRLNVRGLNVGADQVLNYTTSLDHARNITFVDGGQVSNILGQLNSTNVDVFLINPAGIFFGQGAQVNVPNLVASTTDISDASFAKGAETGKYEFDGAAGKADAKIINKGTITIQDGGLAALVAPSVVNEGIIVAKEGKVQLAAGDGKFTLDMYGDRLVNFAVSDSEHERLVKQSGKIAAENGVVLLTTQDANGVVNNAVNLEGVVEARSVVVSGNDIVLGDGSEIVVKDKNTGNGGTVDIRAKNTTVVENGAKITADGVNGGKVEIWGEKAIGFDGQVSAQATSAEGKGGFVETSGDYIAIGDNASVNTLDQNGGAGTWLIDPTDIIISNNKNTKVTGSTPFTPTSDNAASNLNVDTLTKALKSSNVTVQTRATGGQAGNITVADDINVTPGGFNPASRTLTLQAHNDVIINDDVNIGISGSVPILGIPYQLDLVMQAGNGVSLGNGSSINTRGGDVTVSSFDGKGTTGYFSTGINSVINTTTANGAGHVTINADNVGTMQSSTINTNSGFVDGDVVFKGAGTGDIFLGGNIDAGYGAVIATNKGAGVINTTATSDIKAGEINFTTDSGNITVNGTLTAVRPLIPFLSNPGEINLKSTSGTVTVNNKIKATGVSGLLGSVDLESTNGIVQILDTVTVGTGGSVNVEAGKHVDLDARIVGEPIDGLFSLTGNTNKVNVLSDNASIQQGVQLVNTGGEVHLGSDVFEQSVLITKNLKLTGEGAGNTVIQSNLPVGILVVNADADISGMTVDGSNSKAPIAGVVFQNADNSSLTGVELKNNLVGASITDSDDVRIIDSSIHNNGTGILANNSNRLYVDPTYIFGNLVGVFLNNSDNATFVETYIYDNGTGIIATNDSDYLTLDNSEVHNNLVGVHVSGGSDYFYINNGTKIYQNGVGAYVENSDYVNVFDSSIYNNLVGLSLNNSDFAGIYLSEIYGNGLGVAVNDSDYLTSVDTNIHHNLTAGIAFKDSDYAYIYNNNIYLNGLAGVAADNSDNLTVDTSNVYLNGIGVSLANGSDDATVKNSNVALNFTGVNANNSDRLTVDNSQVAANWTGVNLENGSDDATVKNSNIFLNHTGIKANNSNRLTVDTSNVFLNGLLFPGGAGISLENNSDAAKIQNSNVFFNRAGIKIAGGSDNTKVIGSNVFLNLVGINSENSDRLTVDNSNIFLNLIGMNLENSDFVTVQNGSNIFLNLVGANANDSDYLTFDDSNVFLNFVGINAANGSDYLYINNGTNVFWNDVGVQVTDSDYLNVFDSNISGNRVGIKMWNSNFGGIYLSNLNNNSFAAVQAENSDYMTVVDSNFGDNGIGIYTNYGSDYLYVYNGTFTNNTFGISAWQSNFMTVDNSKFYNNGYGVALDTNANDATIKDSYFEANWIGVNANQSDRLTVTDSEFVNNSNIAINLFGSAGSLINNVDVTSNGSPYGIVVDGDGGAIDTDFNNVRFFGSNTQAAMQFQNATLVGDVDVNDVVFNSSGPNGWTFENVTGELPEDIKLAGDMDFGNTVFFNSYGQDIRLINSTMDGFAENVTFVGDGGDPFVREARVWHTLDDSALGTIFYDGFAIVAAAAVPDLAGLIDELSEVGEVYYHNVSSIGKVADTPGLRSAQTQVFNATNNTKVSISANPGTINIPGQSAAQLAGLQPAAGEGTPEELANLETSAGGSFVAAVVASCEVNYVNNFLADEVNSATGSCSTNAQAQ